MAKNKLKIFPDAFKCEDLENKLSGLTAMACYSFTKRDNPNEFNRMLDLLPPGYVAKQRDNLESIDFIYSGSTGSPFLLTLAAGRNDRFHGAEHLDIDVFNIAPNTGSTASYFESQWHHFRDEEGKRTSYQIHPFPITNEERKKDITYATFLTGSTCYFSLPDYEKEKEEFFNMHKKSFGDLNL
ncbi:MAG: hypothetical protein IM551_08005 [Chitinophagaceae bacterium]|nr:hypothetical protein [Chitinophagaceae bacterium]